MNASSHVPHNPTAPYAGDVTPQQAWDMLAAHPDAVMVDVRTVPEWQAGSPDLSELGKITHYISLKHAPDYTFNSHFLDEVASALPNKDVPIYFICKVGGRSASAAAMLTEIGYKHCYNIIGGFEGQGVTPGWKDTKLPWGKE